MLHHMTSDTQNVLTDTSKTLTALSNSDCLVLSGSRWSCWVFQTEVPVPCGCPRSAETGGRLWWISWGTGVPTRASGFHSWNGRLTVNHMEKLGNGYIFIRTNTQKKLLSSDFIWAPVYYILMWISRIIMVFVFHLHCFAAPLATLYTVYNQKTIKKH